jgi:plastocyanin
MEVYMKTFHLPFALLVFSALFLSCGEHPFTNSLEETDPMLKPGGTAMVRFGDHDAGSPFDPADGHDASYHAMDKIVPRNSVISAGGEVTFMVSPFHQVAIYEAGTSHKDIEVSPTTLTDLVLPFPPFLLPDFIIDDPNNRVALSPFMFGMEEWTSPAGTFDTPGKYLIICTTAPHFIFADMYGWITVK